jgi:hypothetical protein
MEMDERAMTSFHTVPLFVALPVCFGGGLLLGFAYFRALRATADVLVKGDRPVLGLVLTLGRLFGLAAGLYVAVLVGGLALLAALAGVLCAKWIMLRKMQGIHT